MSQEKQLTTDEALKFILAGNATFTLVSQKTGARYTYRVKQPKTNGEKTRFVSLLTGPDNESDYTYLGIVRIGTDNAVFSLTAKSKMAISALPVAAFQWTLKKLVIGQEPPNLEIFHAGKCGRCGRTLTMPESIESGYGPECVQLIGATACPPTGISTTSKS